MFFLADFAVNKMQNMCEDTFPLHDLHMTISPGHNEASQVIFVKQECYNSQYDHHIRIISIEINLRNLSTSILLLLGSKGSNSEINLRIEKSM